MVKEVIVKGYFEENCYFYIDDRTGHGFVIDPGAEGERLIRLIDRNGWMIEKILLTHGHFDHIGAVDSIRERYGIPVYAYEGADRYLLHTEMNLSRQCRVDMTVQADHYLREGDRIPSEVDENFYLQTLYAPGHTTDSCIFYSPQERAAFVGDTIFKGSIGNYQYPGGDRETLIRSILEKVFALPEDTVLYSGHSEPTTVGAECARYGV